MVWKSLVFPQHTPVLLPTIVAKILDPEPISWRAPQGYMFQILTLPLDTLPYWRKLLSKWNIVCDQSGKNIWFLKLHVLFLRSLLLDDFYYHIDFSVTTKIFSIRNNLHYLLTYIYQILFLCERRIQFLLTHKVLAGNRIVVLNHIVFCARWCIIPPCSIGSLGSK